MLFMIPCIVILILDISLMIFEGKWHNCVNAPQTLVEWMNEWMNTGAISDSSMIVHSNHHHHLWTSYRQIGYFFFLWILISPSICNICRIWIYTITWIHINSFHWPLTYALLLFVDIVFSQCVKKWGRKDSLEEKYIFFLFYSKLVPKLIKVNHILSVTNSYLKIYRKLHL